MKANRLLPLLISCLVFNFAGEVRAADGGVYASTREAPKTSKTPKGVNLRTARESDRAPFSVRASLAEIRLNQSASKGSAGMTGRLNVFQKFVRVELTGVTPLSMPAAMKTKYMLKERDSFGTIEDSVSIAKQGRSLVIDTGGFKDTVGSQVKSSSTSTTVTSTKYKHAKTEIVGVEITLVDKEGKALFVGSWPEPTSTVVKLPERLRPRVFTSADGRKITATIEQVTADSVTLQMNGRSFTLKLDKLSEPDQKYLKGLLPK